MTRLAGIRECATVGCLWMAQGNARWCQRCREAKEAQVTTPRREAAMDDIAQWRHLVAGWEALARRQVVRGPARWWR